MTFRLEEPAWLWLLTALPLVVAVAALRLRGEEPLRLWLILVLRALLMATLVLALCRPSLVREHEELSVVALVDASDSVRRFGVIGTEVQREGAASTSSLARLRDWLRAASASKRPEDRLGLVVFDGRSAVASSPRRDGALDDEIDRTLEEGTDIAGAIRLGATLLPPDTLRRMVLISDGNQTAGSALEAAREVAAASGRSIPIDVVPIPYRAGEDVRIVRLEAPPAARPGQVVALRVVLEATAPRRGRLELAREGALIDLLPEEAGTGRPIDVPAGLSVHTLLAIADDRPVQRFMATFVPEGSPDAIPENDRADAVVANPAAGAVLLVRGDTPSAAAADGAAPEPEPEPEPEPPLSILLRGLKRAVVSGPPAIVPRNLLEMQSFDLIVLDDVAASQLDAGQQELLVQAVDRLGAGLIMGGGPSSFGAGGWRGTPMERILPVDLELPKALRAPRAALVLVLDKSGSMAFPVAGARASQQQVANEAAALAIESLAARSYVGVVAFDQFAEVIVPIQPNDDPKAMADAVREIRPNGGTDIAEGLDAARRMLASLPAQPAIETKRIVLLTDGRSQRGPIQSIVDDLVAQGASITTIAVGDATDEDVLRRIAERGGGAFHAVRNPRTLPRVLVDSVQVVNRPLIREEPFVPQPDPASPSGGRFAALLEGAPPLGGLVLTSRRSDPTAIVEWSAPPAEGGEPEPILAHWPAGLGRVVAFTSEIEGPWAEEWLGWAGWSAIWSDLVRLAARPGLGSGLQLQTSVEGDRLLVTMTVDDTTSPDGAPPLDPSSVSAQLTLYGPNGRPATVDLRRSGPRAFVAELPLPERGAYVVAVSPRSGDTPLAPLVAGATRPFGEEFGRLRSNIALLREIADATGGRLLELAGEQAPELFDRAGMGSVRAQRGIWSWFLWAAALLLVLDVAARRVAWSPLRMRQALDRSAEAARAQSGRSAATAERLRRRSRAAASGPANEVDREIPAPGDAGATEADGSLPTAPSPAPSPSPSGRPKDAAVDAREAQLPGLRRDADSVRAALDALRGRSQTPQGSPPSPAAGGRRIDAPPAPESSPAADDTSPAPSRDQLLAAKRRARERMQGGAGDGSGDGAA